MCFLFQSHSLDGFHFSFWPWTPMVHMKQVLLSSLRTELGTWFPSSTCCILKQGLWQSITNNEKSWHNTSLYKSKMNFLLGCSFSGTRLGCSDSIFNCLAFQKFCQPSCLWSLSYSPYLHPFAITYPFAIIIYLPPLLIETSSLLSLNIPSTEILNFLCNTPFSDEYANFPLFALLRNFANSWFM